MKYLSFLFVLFLGCQNKVEPNKFLGYYDLDFDKLMIELMHNDDNLDEDSKLLMMNSFSKFQFKLEIRPDSITYRKQQNDTSLNITKHRYKISGDTIFIEKDKDFGYLISKEDQLISNLIEGKYQMIFTKTKNLIQ